MISGMWQAISGMSAFQKKADVTANNVANLNTDGFKKSRAVMVEEPASGPRVLVEKVDISGHRTVDGSTERELSNMDMGEEMLNLTMAERGHEANVKVARAVDEMAGQILDIKA